MKNIFCGILSLALAHTAGAQARNTGNIYIPPGGHVSVWGSFSNTATGSLVNSGNLHLHGDVSSDGATGYDGGTLYLAGNTVQALGGDSTFNTTGVVFNNAAGFVLNTKYSIGGTAAFTAGIVTAATAATPLEFNPEGAGGTAIAAAGVSDAAHVNGYTRQLGTGAFTYPVGDGARYQPIAANLSGNSGMSCLYQAGDAGSGIYLSTGLEAVPLMHYNRQEYWELEPVGSTAAGTVTVFYDDYRNTGIGGDYATALKVAHKAAGGWQNEGGILSGSEASGTVTTAGSLAAWGPFTLGSITDDSPLPLSVTGFAVTVQDCQAMLSWTTGDEAGLESFELQYSTDARIFTALEMVAAHGSGSHYSMLTDVPAKGRCFFRLCLKHANGTYSYSKVLSAQLDCGGASIAVYPNPLRQGNDLFVRLEGYNNGADATIYDITGRKFSSQALREGENKISTAALAAAGYMLEIRSSDHERQVFKLSIVE